MIDTDLLVLYLDNTAGKHHAEQEPPEAGEGEGAGAETDSPDHEHGDPVLGEAPPLLAWPHRAHQDTQHPRLQEQNVPLEVEECLSNLTTSDNSQLNYEQ